MQSTLIKSHVNGWRGLQLLQCFWALADVHLQNPDKPHILTLFTVDNAPVYSFWPYLPCAQRRIASPMLRSSAVSELCLGMLECLPAAESKSAGQPSQHVILNGSHELFECLTQHPVGCPFCDNPLLGP